MANSYRSQMHRPPSNHGGDVRTPDAWRQRENNLHHGRQPQHGKHQQQQQRPQSAAGSTTTTADETSSEVETSVSGRRYNRLNAPPPPPMYARGHHHHYHNGSNTLRSTRSVPALNLGGPWPDEPCPIHGGGHGHHQHHHNHHQHQNSNHAMMQHLVNNGHHPSLLRGNGVPAFHLAPPPPQGFQYPATMRRAGSMFDVRVSNNPVSYQPATYSAHPMPGYGPPGPPPDKKSHYGSLRSLHSISALQMGVPPGAIPPPYHLPPMPPPHLLPPGMRPRPLVIPAGAEPLPVRDPAKSKGGSIISGHTLIGPNGMPVLGGGGKLALVGDDYKPRRRYHCCRGPLPLVWFIITIVTLGVVLGVVLGSIYG